MTAQGFSATRLYIGNLSASTDEYTLMQVCAKHGKIVKLDYLFHKTGPAKGKPRGYAFVEYSTKEEALRAMVALHGKLVRGRNLIVTAASDQSAQDPSIPRKRQIETGRPTTISLLKGQGVAGASTNKKIATLEAKLAALREAKPASPSPEPAPIASTSKTDTGPSVGTEGTAAADDSTAQDWLDSLEAKPSDRSISKRKAEDPILQAEKEREDDAKKRKIVVDAKAAGLPAKPNFKAMPPKERS